ncbi:hypothetical protein A2Z33_06415 [Candidatus Gottesmanbacteria bacterium RBG_16_52_11]|uniref:Class F sortase n=1 Tax=Candidatus Gottesmanbacteria bacterium RBG_16_52_11 TaxID=1798374 RepID=A0A1F5YXU5_9BACT|nr:MAG: hypothetical protein A2Z33_06415 [Candidatus Gottesmanbacteria bacterium RBG_16_52_11]
MDIRRTGIIILVVAGLAAAIISAGRFHQPVSEPMPLGAATGVRVGYPTAVAPARPARPLTISIPAINVAARVEYVRTDRQGNMDVPADADNAAWFEPGYLPGATGNAVIAGHYDKADGSPAAFYRLSGLVPGDIAEVSDENGAVRKFQVVRVESFDSAEFPLDDVFGPADTINLNLITCSGTWNAAAKNYSRRTVVFTRLIPE